MGDLATDCPRCGVKKVTFDLVGQHFLRMESWRDIYEVFAVCRDCAKSTIFVLGPEDGSVEMAQISKKPLSFTNRVQVIGYVSTKDQFTTSPPEYLPENISKAFVEGAAALAVGCPNAAGTMFRLCVDLATENLLPPVEDAQPNGRTRRDLGLRLPWLFDNGKLPGGLKDLSDCIKDDGNDGAHRGTLKEHEAQDMLDFTYALLDRLYTEPERIKIAQQRKLDRAKTAGSAHGVEPR